MSKLRRILLLAVFTLSLLPTLAFAADSTHTVQAGETLTSIAAQYGTTVDALVAANNLSSANLIYVGQNLKLPGAATDASPTTAPTAATPAATAPTSSTTPSDSAAKPGDTYIVQAGDSLYGIALKYGTTVDALLQANGLTDRNFIYAGQRLTIPGTTSAAPSGDTKTPAVAPTAQPTATTAPAAPAAAKTYTVQAGDTLGDIAARFGVSVDALIAANNITNPNLLFSGNVLTIPGANSAAGDTPKPTATNVAPTAIPPSAAQPTATTAPANSGPGNAEANLPSKNPDEGVKPSTPTAGETVTYVVQGGDLLYKIAAAYGTTVDAIVAKNGLSSANLIYPGQKLQIVVGDMTGKPAVTNPNEPAKGTGDEALVPNTTIHTGKWIDVNVSTQRLVAYEGDTPVYNAIVSTGVSAHPTVIGTFKIYAKYQYDDMTGGVGAEYYYLPNVPHTMYFYGGYAIHGTYWHNNFGHPMSHGCVNLNQTDAEWMYNWAPVGTVVTTHW